MCMCVSIGMQRSEELELQAFVSWPIKVLTSKFGLLEEQGLFLTAEAFLQLPDY